MYLIKYYMVVFIKKLIIYEIYCGKEEKYKK